MHKTLLIYFYVISTLTFNITVAAGGLTNLEINNQFANVINRRNQPRNGPNTSFRLQQFFKRATYPLALQVDSENTILSLRNLYMNVLPNNLGAGIHIINILREHLSNTKFVDSKLLESEIRFLNQFVLGGNATAINGGAPAVYQGDIDNRTANFSRMVGRITLANGSVTGTLIPLPVLGGGHQWAVLTCGHIIEAIAKADNAAEVAMFTLNGMIPIPISAVKVFKRNGRESFTSYNAMAYGGIGTIATSPWNAIGLNNLARSLPRYDIEGDVAICYLSDNIGIINTQALLNVFYPIAGFGFANNHINFTIGGNDIHFYFVDNLPIANAIVVAINALPKNHNFIIGYADFNPLSQTLSIARNGPGLNPAIPLYATFIDVPTVTGYNFFHDAPMCSGMSGGPIFNFTPGGGGAPNTIHVYGVVRCSNFNVIGPAALPSRCNGSFLQANLLK